MSLHFYTSDKIHKLKTRPTNVIHKYTTVMDDSELSVSVYKHRFIEYVNLGNVANAQCIMLNTLPALRYARCAVFSMLAVCDIPAYLCCLLHAICLCF